MHLKCLPANLKLTWNWHLFYLSFFFFLKAEDFKKFVQEVALPSCNVYGLNNPIDWIPGTAKQIVSCHFFCEKDLACHGVLHGVTQRVSTL